MIDTLLTDPENEKYNRVCKGAYPSYKGKRQCIYNIAKSMSEAYDFLWNEVSHNIVDWQWKNVHVNEYPNIPLSFTPFKPFFHKEVPIGGNANTVKVSKYSFKRLKAMKAFKSTHTPNYKQVIQFADNAQDEKMLYSFDGGQSGNLFAGHYFDFNEKHSSGHLMEAVIGKPAVELKKHQKLLIKPITQKPAGGSKVHQEKRPVKQSGGGDNNQEF